MISLREMDRQSARDLLVAAAPSAAIRAALLDVRLAAIDRFLNLKSTGSLLAAQDAVRRLSLQRSPLLPAIFGQSALLNQHLADSAEAALTAVLIGLSYSKGTLPKEAMEIPIEGSVFSDPLRCVAVVAKRLRRCVLNSSGLHIEHELASGVSRQLDFAPGSRAPTALSEGAEIIPYERVSLHGARPFVAWAPTGLPYPIGASANDPDGKVRAALLRGRQLLERWEPSWVAWLASCERLYLSQSGAAALVDECAGTVFVLPTRDGVEAGERLLRSERCGLIASLVGAEHEKLAHLAAQAAVVNFLDWIVRIEDPQLNQDEVVARRATARLELSALWEQYRSTDTAVEPLRAAVGDVVRTYSPISNRGATPAGGRRLLFVNLDTRDFIYSYFWGRAVLEESRRQGFTVDALMVNPFVNRDLAAELGVPRSSLDDRSGATAAYVDGDDPDAAKAALATLTEGHEYDTLIINCETAFFLHLLMDRGDEFASARWLIYDRHLHDDLRSHSGEAAVVERIKQFNMHLFAIQEISVGGPTDGGDLTRTVFGRMADVWFSGRSNTLVPLARGRGVLWPDSN